MERVAEKINSAKDSRLTRSFFLRKEQSKPLFFQPKLTIGPTDDVYEREADAVADKVMRMSDTEQVQTKSSAINIQRKCAACEEEEQLQRKEDGNGAKQLEAPSIVSDALESGGSPLDDNSRSFMENRIGYDFSRVKIHTDTVATKSAQSINALAYTSGNSIVFNEGQYSPNTENGKKLLAHELTHVVQQNGMILRRVQRASNFCKAYDPTTTVAAEQVQTKSLPINIQRKCEACEEEEQLQRKEVEKSEEEFEAPPNGSDVLGSGGNPLDDNSRSFMENRFRCDFSNVKIPADAVAGKSAQSINALSYASGNSLVFNEGQFSPGTENGRRALAHQLTHIIQQGSSVAVRKKELPLIQRDEIQEDDSIEAVYNALDGWTDSDDSLIIWNNFASKSKTASDKIVSGVASKAEIGVDETLDWMASDMVTSDWNNLLAHLVTVDADRTDHIIANQVYSYLSGFTSESNSASILNIYKGATPVVGDLLGRSLIELETVTELTTRNETIDYLFGDLALLDAHNLSLHFFNSGSTYAAGCAAYWIASKVRDLISGYTSMSDSASVVANFERTPKELQSTVLYELDLLCLGKWEETAATSLMKNMQQGDYEQLRAMMPVLPVYDVGRTWLEWAWDKLLIGFDYAAALYQYGICGIVGITWGVITVVADVLVAIVDIGIAIIDILGMIAYFISGGTICRENKENVWKFFSAMGELFGAPGDAIGKMWDELILEASLIEGPFKECQQSIFWVSRVTNLLVNILLIFAWGYGAVKTALKGIEAIVTMARAGKLVAALEGLPAKVWVSIKNLPAAAAKSSLAGIAKVVELVRNPVQIIAGARNTLTVVRLAAEDQGYFKFLRKQMGEAIADESTFWKERRDFWKKSADTVEGGLNETESALAKAVEAAVDDPQKAEALVTEAEQSAKASEKTANDLMDDVNGKKTEEPKKPDEAEPGKKKEEPIPTVEPKIEAEGPSLDGKRRVQVDEAGKCRVCATPCDDIKAKYKDAIDRIKHKDYNSELELVEADTALTPEQKLARYEILEQEIVDFVKAEEITRKITESGLPLAEQYKDAPLGEQLGEGQDKLTYVLKDHPDTAIAIVQDLDVSTLINEVTNLHKLRDAGIRIADIMGLTSHNGKPAMVMKKYSGMLKPTGFFETPSAVNAKTIKDLNAIMKIVEAEGIDIRDVQFLIAEDGSALAADPLDVTLNAPRTSATEIEGMIFKSMDKIFTEKMIPGQGYTAAELQSTILNGAADEWQLAKYLREASNARIGFLRLEEGKYYIMP